MQEPWNDPTILPPPVHTSHNNKEIDKAELTHTCKHIVRVLSQQSPLHKEGAIISRLLYKFDKKFRNDIGYRNLKKVNTALKKYLLLNLLKDVENFSSSMPGEDDDYLPTRQMLEYILVRLLTFAKLMLRICVCSKQAAVFYMDRIKRGESHWMCLMPYALLSRVWSISMILIQHSCSWYTCLYKQLNKLNLKGLDFLPTNYELPVDVEEWLDIQNLDNIGRLQWSQKKSVNISLSLCDDEDADAFDNILEYVNQINNEDVSEIESEILPVKFNSNNSGQLHITPIQHIDQGEAISRESFILQNFQNKMENKKVIHSFERITNILSLQEFINKEESFRQDGTKQSLTKHLSLMQWHALKKSLLQQCDSISKNRKIERKIQKIWKEKCLDYI